MPRKKPKVKTGKLTLTEKYAIQGALSEKKQPAEIADMLNRSEGIVSRYITTELDNLHQQIAEAQVEAAENKTQEKDPQTARYSRASKLDIQQSKPSAPKEPKSLDEIASENTITEAYRELVKAGVLEERAKTIIEAALNKASDTGAVFKSSNDLFVEALKQMSAGDFMQKKSEGGQTGVTVMTHAASQRLDHRQSPNHNNNEHIYNPQG